MPKREVELTPELDTFIRSKVETGMYADPGEVIRAALRLLARDEQEQEEKVAALKDAVRAGISSGMAEPGSFDRIRTKYGLLRREA